MNRRHVLGRAPPRVERTVGSAIGSGQQTRGFPGVLCGCIRIAGVTVSEISSMGACAASQMLHGKRQPAGFMSEYLSVFHLSLSNC
jgi:hypothetical protein